MKLWIWFCMLATVAQCQKPKLTAGLTWANMAWGFDDGGEDSIEGMKVVIVDPDYISKEQVAQMIEDKHIVLCYISVGTIEGFRDDYKQNKQAWDALALGRMSTWDETWLDIRRTDEVMELMTPRFLRAKALGCQGIEPDNMDCSLNADCFRKMNGVSNGSQVKADQIGYLTRLSELANSLGMSIVMKNAVELIQEVHGLFDGAVTENCLRWQECGPYKTYFVDNNKAHFAVEYDRSATNCLKAYPGMMMKFCNPQIGGYLCRKREREWRECFSPLQELPETDFVPTDAPVSSVTKVPTVSPSSASGLSRVKLTAGMTWANMAWGFDDGGEDSIEGMKAVIVDPDYISKEQVAQMTEDKHIVLCYISVGTIEGFRDDYKQNKQAWDALALGRMSTWDETWLDIRRTDEVMELMTPRFLRAKALGCQGIEPDNMDCSLNADCFRKMNGVSNGSQVKADQIRYLTRLSELAHSLGMSIVMKNAVELIQDVYELFDGAVTENCLRWQECGPYKTYFVDNNKAHFAVEYNGDSQKCNAAYSGMMMKYCSPQPGGYLCKTSDEEWSECFEMDDQLPETEYEFEIPPELGKPDSIPLACVDEHGLVSTRTSYRRKNLFGRVNGPGATCYYVSQGDLEGNVRIAFDTLVLRRDESLQVIAVDEIDGSDALGATLVKTFTRSLRRIKRSDRSMTLQQGKKALLVYTKRSRKRQLRFKLKHWVIRP